MSKELAKDPKVAAEHISAELNALYPEGVFELFLHTRDAVGVRRKTGSLATLMPHFTRFCSEFPEAIVQYNPAHRHDIVSVVTCDCSEMEISPCPEKCEAHRYIPRVYLRLIKDGPRDIPADSCPLTPAHET